MIDLTDQEKGILATIGGCTSWYVDENNLVAVAHLVESGLARIASDYDVRAVFVTPEGMEVAKALKLIEVDKDNPRSWTRTEYGCSLTK